MTASFWAKWADTLFIDAFDESGHYEPELFLDPAIEHLGLTKPIHIVFVENTPSNSPGEYVSRELGVVLNDFHLVRIAYWSPPWLTNFVLWHELTHAAQTERLGSAEAFMEEYSRNLPPLVALFPSLVTWRDYLSNPLEREAYRNMNKALFRPLVK